MSNNHADKTKLHLTQMSVTDLENLLSAPGQTNAVKLFPGNSDCRLAKYNIKLWDLEEDNLVSSYRCIKIVISIYEKLIKLHFNFNVTVLCHQLFCETNESIKSFGMAYFQWTS